MIFPSDILPDIIALEEMQTLPLRHRTDLDFRSYKNFLGSRESPNFFH